MLLGCDALSPCAVLVDPQTCPCKQGCPQSLQCLVKLLYTPFHRWHIAGMRQQTSKAFRKGCSACRGLLWAIIARNSVLLASMGRMHVIKLASSMTYNQSRLCKDGIDVP